MAKSTRNQVIVPRNSGDGDSRDSSLVVYTLTVAIAVALFALSLALPDNNLYCRPLNLLSSSLLAGSMILAFLSIEYLVDITSFASSNSNKEAGNRGHKYLNVLRFYNLSVILIITATLLLLTNYFLTFSITKSYCYNLNWVIDLALIIFLLAIWLFSTLKWWSDLYFLYDAEAIEIP